jgi:acetyl-CoA carboxylase biotin carboxyl carrier protein
MMSLSASEIRVIIDALQAADWDQATVVIGDVRIAVARNGLALPGESTTATAPEAAPAPAPIQAAPAQAAAAVPAPAPVIAPAPAPEPAPAGHVISAPSVGVFWRSPEPGAASFVEVGSHVEPGDTIGIVEVMKLMSNVAADVAGEIIAIHAENASTVEYGTPLVTIKVGAAG